MDAYVHAITAQFPRLRYIVGYDAQFLIIPLCFVPTWIQDVAVRYLTKVPVPASVMKERKNE